MGQRRAIRSGGVLWTADVGKAMRVAKAIQFGTVWINDHFMLVVRDAPRRLQGVRLRQGPEHVRDRGLHGRQARDAQDLSAIGFPPGLGGAILTWYATRARSLPFRTTTDPFAILVSEAMAQQTQAARAGEAWTGFMARFPTVGALAAAPPADVLREWRGLGYNRRALNLWRAARRIVEVFDGQVPSDLDDLQSLPGVGPYTARAVAALAFGSPVGAVDTNVRRVLGRIVAGDAGDIVGSPAPATCRRGRPGGPCRRVDACADGRGRTLCRPRRPDCGACPAKPWCRYAGLTDVRARASLTTAAGAQARSPARIGEAPAPFRATSRWLRGRILDRLREAPNGEWVSLEGKIGEHGPVAVEAAARAMAKDGLLELDFGAPVAMRARLPIA